MGFKLVRVDATEPCKIPLQAGAYFFGRGISTASNYVSLECDDARVSRRHGSMEVTADTVVIEALHVNPCFYKKKLSETKVLSLSERIELANGDQFGLVPDCFWYEVIYCTDEVPNNEVPTEEAQTENNDEVTGSPSLIAGGPITPPNTAAYQLDPGELRPGPTESPSFTQDNTELDPIISASFDSPLQLNESYEHMQQESGIENPINSPQTGKHNDSTSSPSTPSKRVHSPEPSPDRTQCDEPNLDSKKVKTEPISPEAKETKVKVEPESPDAAKPGPSHDQPGSSTDGAFPPPVAGAPPSPAKAPPPRERCFYGADCYRKNAQHKRQYSHPSDADYGTGEESACPAGAACVRLDARHWAARDHPPGVAPPPRRLGHGRLGPPKKRRKVVPKSESEDEDSDDPAPDLIVNGKRQRKTVARQSWSGSEEEDPYATDESDEWQPSGDVTTSQSQSQNY